MNDLSTAIEGHKAESERLGQLTNFVKSFAPAIDETRSYAPTIEPPEDITEFRDKAIAEAFKAIERIARSSFLPAPARRQAQ